MAANPADPIDFADFEKAIMEFTGPRRRQDWLQNNYVVGYEATPYISDVHTAYIRAFPVDCVSLEEFKEAVEKVYPTLKGYPPRSLKPKRKDPTKLAAPSSVRPALRQFDGANDADIGPRIGAAGAESTASPVGSVQSARRHVTERTAYSIYEESETRPGPDSQTSKSGQAPALNECRTSDVRVSTHIRASKESHRRSPAAVQHTDETTYTTAFRQFAHHWQQIAPGGAFAQTKATPRTRLPNLLSWKF